MLHVHLNINLHNHIRAKPQKKQNKRGKKSTQDENEHMKIIWNKPESVFEEIKEFLLLFFSTMVTKQKVLNFQRQFFEVF